uniref:ACB domain-containing protein n=1 Tax=Heterorhabditis bacteriophora TaxID=37862 RepID=A0A1I7XTD9_HETBA
MRGVVIFIALTFAMVLCAEEIPHASPIRNSTIKDIRRSPAYKQIDSAPRAHGFRRVSTGVRRAPESPRSPPKPRPVPMRAPLSVVPIPIPSLIPMNIPPMPTVTFPPMNTISLPTLPTIEMPTLPTFTMPPSFQRLMGITTPRSKILHGDNLDRPVGFERENRTDRKANHDQQPVNENKGLSSVRSRLPKFVDHSKDIVVSPEHNADWIVPFRKSFSSAQDLFVQAQENLKKLSEEPDVDVKLKIYALFKQATSGDVTGNRPNVMDFAGRAKFDAWANVKGISQNDAMIKYAQLIESLGNADMITQQKGVVPDGLKPVPGLDVTIEGKVFKITLNRPKKFNALTFDMYNGIIAALEASSANKTTVVTVITGAGNFFCSGNDLSNFSKAVSASKAEVKAMAEEAAIVLQKYIQAYIDHDKPLIALINGPAVGIAVTVLPLFDAVLSTDKSSFHTPFATLGQSPEGASSYTFPITMGQLKASEVLLFSKKLSAAEALERGLITEVIPDAEFASTSANIVKQYADLPPETLRINKGLLRSLHKDALTKTNEVECATIKERWQSKECASAIAAFLSRSK